MELNDYKKNFFKARKKTRKTSKGNVSDFLGEDFLKRFRVFHPQTLFEPDWELLKQGHCPICRNKLKVSRSKPIVYCNGVKHKRNFVISKEKYNKIRL